MIGRLRIRTTRACPTPPSCQSRALKARALSRLRPAAAGGAIPSTPNPRHVSAVALPLLAGLARHPPDMARVPNEEIVAPVPEAPSGDVTMTLRSAHHAGADRPVGIDLERLACHPAAMYMHTTPRRVPKNAILFEDMLSYPKSDLLLSCSTFSCPSSSVLSFSSTPSPSFSAFNSSNT